MTIPTRYLIEYAGVVNGASYGFEPFEAELHDKLMEAAGEVFDKLAAHQDDFIKAIRVTEISPDVGAQDVTEDVLTLAGEMLEDPNAVHHLLIYYAPEWMTAEWAEQAAWDAPLAVAAE